MAIQLRRGAYTDFDPNKMLSGELAVVTSGDPASATGRTLYVCFEPGVVKRIVSYEDFENELEAATEEIQEAFTEEIQAKIAACTAAISAANSAQEAANTAAAAANAAAEAASAYVLGDISSKTVEFSEAADRVNIATGESTATLFGKIKKFFSDLKTVAFTGSYSDLSGKPTFGEAAWLNVANNLTTNVAGYLMDARQGKALNEKYDELNTKIENISQQITVLGSATSTFSLESVPNSRRILVFTNKSIFSIIKWSSSLAISPMLNEEDAVITAGTYPNIVIKNNLTSGNYIKFIC